MHTHTYLFMSLLVNSTDEEDTLNKWLSNSTRSSGESKPSKQTTSLFGRESKSWLKYCLTLPLIKALQRLEREMTDAMMRSRRIISVQRSHCRSRFDKIISSIYFSLSSQFLLCLLYRSFAEPLPVMVTVKVSPVISSVTSSSTEYLTSALHDTQTCTTKCDTTAITRDTDKMK